MFTKKHFINLISLTACALITLFFLIKVSKEFNLSYLWAVAYNVFWLSMVVLLDIWGQRKVRNFVPVFITISVLLVYFGLILTGYTKEILWLSFDQNFLFSAVVFLTIVYLAEKTAHIKNYYLLVNSIFFGLMLYYNIILLLPLIIFAFYYYRQNLIMLLLFILMTSLVVIYSPQLYGAIFLKYQFHTVEFFSINFWVILLAGLALYTGWIVADSQELYFTIGLFLFLPKIIENIIEGNNVGIDSYIISLPFFLMAIRNYKVDKFLGKVYQLR